MKTITSGVMIFTLTIFSLLVSCNKYDNPEIPAEFANPKEEIGKLHNEQLKFILENIQEIPEKGEIKQHVEKILHNKYPSMQKSGLSLASLPDFPANFEDLDLIIWLDEFAVSSQLKEEISKTFEIFQTAPSLGYIINAIEAKEKEASNMFQGKDLELYYEHLAVAKYTSVFWYPEEEGGENGIKYLEGYALKSTSSINTINWWKVFGVDCVGGLMGSAVGYAGASAISVIMQL